MKRYEIDTHNDPKLREAIIAKLESLGEDCSVPKALPHDRYIRTFEDKRAGCGRASCLFLNGFDYLSIDELFRMQPEPGVTEFTFEEAIDILRTTKNIKGEIKITE